MLLRIHRLRLRRYHRRGSKGPAKIHPHSDRCFPHCRLFGVLRRLDGLNDRPSLLRAEPRCPVPVFFRKDRMELGEMGRLDRRYLRPVRQVSLPRSIARLIFYISPFDTETLLYLRSLLGAMFPLPRVIYAMASDGLIFEWMGKISSRFHTPLMGTFSAGILTGS